MLLRWLTLRPVYSVNGMRLANESLAHGIYIVRLTNGKQTFVKRIAY